MVTARERQVFDQLLDEAIAGLPPHIHELLEEIPLIVEDEPDPVLRDEVLGDGGGDLCGLHWGVPLTCRSVETTPDLPDRMMLFRGPILRLSGYRHAGPGLGRQRGLTELRRQIKITLLHEIGHHFGLDESQLEALGYG